MNKQYIPDWEDISDVVNDSTCVWKKTIILNAEGIGTTFDVKNLTEKGLKCYECSGFDYSCKGYMVEGKKE